VKVAVRKTGNDRAAPKVHELRAAAFVAHDLAVRTHGDEAAVPDRECPNDLAIAGAIVPPVAIVVVAETVMLLFMPATSGIDCDHLTIEEDLVGLDPGLGPFIFFFRCG
jgi:hypothetical protein